MNTSIGISSGLRTLALAGALACTSALAAPTVAISGATGVAPGSAFQLQLSASGFTDLYAYQFDISFDPALFKATGVTQGAFLATAGATFFDAGTVDNTAGTLSIIVESLIGPGPGAQGAGNLVQLNFEAIGPRQSSGRFSVSNFSVLDSALNATGASVQGLAVAIPEPSPMALVLAALGACWLGSARRPGGAGRAAGASA